MRTARALSALAVCLVLVAVLTFVGKPDGPGIAYADRGPDGWARSPSLEARVTSVAVARLLIGRSGATMSTAARFVVIGVEVRVHGYRQSVPARLHTVDGHVYAERTEGVVARPPAVNAGFTGFGTVVFEVPGERVTGATLVLGPVREGFVQVFAGALRFPDVVANASTRRSVSMPAATTQVTR